MKTVLVNVAQLIDLVDERLRCRQHDGWMRVTRHTTLGLATTLHMKCDKCSETEIWDADECRVCFTNSHNKTTSALTVRMVFAMMTIGMARASCNLVLQTMNVKVTYSYVTNTLITCSFSHCTTRLTNGFQSILSASLKGFVRLRSPRTWQRRCACPLPQWELRRMAISRTLLAHTTARG